MSNILSPERARATSPRNAITAACTAVSVTPPIWPADDLVAALADVPTLDAERVAIGAEVRVRDGFHPEWIEAAVARIAHATAADQLRRDSAGAMAGRMMARIAPEGNEAAAAVAKKANALLRQLEKLAAVLPDRSPLDDAAAVAAGVGGELKSARETMATLATVAEVHRPWTRIGDVVMAEQRPGWRWLFVALVEPDLVDVEQRAANEFGHRVLNPSPARSSLRKLIEDAGRDLDLALVDVARGKYEGAKLSWAGDRAAVQERLKRLTTAEAVEMKAPERTRVAPPVTFFDAFGWR